MARSKSLSSDLQNANSMQSREVATVQLYLLRARFISADANITRLSVLCYFVLQLELPQTFTTATSTPTPTQFKMSHISEADEVVARIRAYAASQLIAQYPFMQGASRNDILDRTASEIRNGIIAV